MMEVLGSDYIRTARAKGLREQIVVYKHALRNALLPVVTIAGLQFSHIFSGAVVIETVFNWPGLGTLALESILRADTPTIMGILFFSAFVVIVFNLLTICFDTQDNAPVSVNTDNVNLSTSYSKTESPNVASTNR